MADKPKTYPPAAVDGSTDRLSEIRQREKAGPRVHRVVNPAGEPDLFERLLYHRSDFQSLHDLPYPFRTFITSLQTLDDLLERDEQREKDGFHRRIRLGKIVKPTRGKQGQVVVVPTTTEPKFYHDRSTTQEEEESTGGSGEGEEGEVIGEQPLDPQEGEGGAGAGQGESAEHEVGSNAYELGKILTEKFSLPNLKAKGKKRSFSKFIYDLTDRHRGFGQILDKQETLRRIIQTNSLLGNVQEAGNISTEDLIINPRDKIYRVLSREKDFETQAIVFFVRDYSGSMEGQPTEVIATQHLLIYSWLAYQYKNNVETRFILHDTEAKEAPDFYTYYNSQVAGGTHIYPAYNMVIDIVEKEQLARDYNIYVFHGTDGDDWEANGEKALQGLRQILTFSNRTGITVARNNWGSAGETTVERYLNASGLLNTQADLVKMDVLQADDASEERIIEGIRKLTSED